MIERLRIERLRVIRHADIPFDHGIHWFHGPNGSGKTTIIEAIHLLSTGRTFTGKAELDPLIQDGQAGMSIRLDHSEHGGFTLHKARGEDKRLTRNTQDTMKQNEIARLLPLVTVHAQSHLLIDGPAVVRRRYLDWGLFHVDEAFVQQSQHYARLLKQRNASLRQGLPDRLVRSWDELLGEAGERLKAYRENHLQTLKPYIDQCQQALLPEREVGITLRPGWSRQAAHLTSALADNLEQDRLRGYTGVGAHRAELAIQVDRKPARERLSRGEKRRLALTLRLAQLLWYANLKGHPPVCLLDDFGMELDESGGRTVLELIERSGAQTLVTTTEHLFHTYLPHTPVNTVFHVKHGEVQIHRSSR